MLAFTHLATGVFLASATAMAVKPSHLETQLLILGGLIGSLLPDIDHPRSWIGRRILFISLPLSALVGHRGVTHSLLAILATAAIAHMVIKRTGLDLGVSSFSVQ